MNFRHLNIFLVVSEELNMTRAARKLYMSQPSVSQVIAELEDYYETRLFERLNHRLYLTAAGIRLQAYARHLINLEAQAKKELADVGRAGLLRVGASQTVGAYLLPDVIKNFREFNPQVEIFSRVENTWDIEQFLLEDRLDLGLVEGRIHSSDLLERTIVADDLSIVCAPEHSLALKVQVLPTDLSFYPFIVREVGSGTREIFANQMLAAGATWKESGVYNSSEAIKRAVMNDLGLAVLPMIAIKREIEAGTLIALNVQGLSLQRQFNLVYHRQKFISKAMQAFLNSLTIFQAITFIPK
ncbi:MAG: LysR substrate-binding domain-containing protein [Anaerolineae bacterium]|nr:LysR substrate-binding domain-containing protein [Anaerolineae bacterium]